MSQVRDCLWVAATLGWALIGSLAMTTPAPAAEELKVGDKAPPFTLQASDGKTYSLKDFEGKKGIVVAWFPKAFTQGCTIECKSFSEAGAKMKDMNFMLFAASVDPVDQNKKFAESLNAAYPILSDPEKSVAKAYGVLNESRGFANRWTFYIDKTGVIREIDKKITTSSAAADVAEKAKKLGMAD